MDTAIHLKLAKENRDPWYGIRETAANGVYYTVYMCNTVEVV